MKNEDIRVDMWVYGNSFVPYIEVDYMDKDAQEHSALMLLDSGSSESILASEMAYYIYIGASNKFDDKVTPIYDASEYCVETYDARLPFVMGGVQFHESFCLCNEYHISFVDDLPVIGILVRIPAIPVHQFR